MRELKLENLCYFMDEAMKEIFSPAALFPMSLNIGARLLILLTEQINDIVNRQNFMRAKSSVKIAVVYFSPF